MIHELKINKNISYDVVVCGGGTTGFAAATQAARAGKKAIIIEKNGCLGGVATAGSVKCLLGGIDYEDGIFKFVTGGIFKELYYSLRQTGDCVDIYKINRQRSPHAWYSGLSESIIFDNEAMKRLMENIVLNSGADILYFSHIIDVGIENEEIKYVLIANKDGVTAVNGKVFIDTTGDGDIAFLSGCTTEKGRPEDGLMMPATLIMDLAGVDTETVLSYIQKHNSPRFKEEISALAKDGKWDFPIEIFISMLLNQPGHHMINSLRQVGIDGTDASSLTKGMIEGRADNKRLYDIIKENIPGYNNSIIASMAETIGIRETRRIVGEFKLTLDDLINGKDFEDVIALSSYCFDVPDPKKPSYQPLEGKKIKKKYAEIPYRCMLPDKVGNLIAAGRNISVEREVMGPLRVMGPCIGMGQAAGLAAAVTCDNGIKIQKININNLKNTLIDNDCIIKESDICIVRR